MTLGWFEGITGGNQLPLGSRRRRRENLPFLFILCTDGWRSGSIVMTQGTLTTSNILCFLFSNSSLSKKVEERKMVN